MQTEDAERETRCPGLGAGQVQRVGLVCAACCLTLALSNFSDLCRAPGNPRTASLNWEKTSQDSFGVNNFREMCSLTG